MILSCTNYCVTDYCFSIGCQIKAFCRLNYNIDSLKMINNVILIYNIFLSEWGIFKEDLIYPLELKRFIIGFYLNEFYFERCCNIIFRTIGHCSKKGLS